MMPHPLRRLVIELTFLDAVQAIRELFPGPQCTLVPIHFCLRRPSLALVLEVILTDYLAKNILELTALVIEVTVENLIILFLRLGLAGILTAEVHIVCIRARCWENPSEAVPPCLGEGAWNVHELTHEAEFF